MNDDGFGDVIVGAPNFTDDLHFEGAAYVYLGSASGLPSTPTWIHEGNQGGIDMGCSVGTAGDVDGDGFDDVIVGALLQGPAYGGGAAVWLGSPSGLSSKHTWSYHSYQSDSEFGSSVGTAGDVNGDGLPEVIVGAPKYAHPEAAEGWAAVFGHG